MNIYRVELTGNGKHEYTKATTDRLQAMEWATRWREMGFDARLEGAWVQSDLAWSKVRED